MSQLYVEVLGRGPDLVLLHGWGMHGGVWAGLRASLAERFRLYLIDLPGHGASPTVAPYDLDAVADAVADAMPSRAHVCGWSLGGLIALRLAETRPARVHKLVLMATNPCFRQRADWAHGLDDATLAEFAAGLESDYAGTLKRFLSLQARSGDDARQVIAALRAQLFERGEPGLPTLRAGLALLRDVDFRAAVPSIPMPTLVLHGARDMLAPVEAGEWLARRLPDGRLQRIEGCAHAPFLSHPVATLAALKEFLGD